MILRARKNGMDFIVVLCLRCDRAHRVTCRSIGGGRKRWKLPVGWERGSGDTDAHLCPRCATRDESAVEARAVERADKLLTGWIGQGLTEQRSAKEDVEQMREDLVAAFTEAEDARP